MRLDTYRQGPQPLRRRERRPCPERRVRPALPRREDPHDDRNQLWPSDATSWYLRARPRAWYEGQGRDEGYIVDNVPELRRAATQAGDLRPGLEGNPEGEDSQDRVPKWGLIPLCASSFRLLPPCFRS